MRNCWCIVLWGVIFCCFSQSRTQAQERQKKLVSDSLVGSPQMVLPVLPYSLEPVKPLDMKSYVYKMPNFQQGGIVKATALPAGLILVGLGFFEKEANTHDTWYQNKHAFQDKMQESFPNFKTSVDDYFQFLPMVGMAGLNICGARGKHSPGQQIMLAGISQLVMSSVVYPMKKWCGKRRPDNTASNSLPSGHTAQSFLSATLLHKEYGHKSPWISVAGFSMATACGVCRVLNNRHWVSDVLVGAGIGIGSVNLTYWCYNKLRKGKRDLAIVPVAAPGNHYGVAFHTRF